MQVNLTIDGEQFAGTFEALIAKLDPDQVKELTLQIVKNFLGADPEFNFFKAEVADRARKSYGYNADTYQISSEDREKLQKFRSSRQVLIETITKTSTDHVLEQVKKWVEEDEFLKKVYADVKAEVVKEFPTMVMTSIVGWFARNMDEMRSAVQDTYGVYEVGQRLSNIVNKLQQKYLSDGQPVLNYDD